MLKDDEIIWVGFLRFWFAWPAGLPNLHTPPNWGLALTIKYLFCPSLKCNYLAVYGLQLLSAYNKYFELIHLIFWWFWAYIHYNLKLAPLDFSELFCNSGFSRLFFQSSQHLRLSVRHVYTLPNKQTATRGNLQWVHYISRFSEQLSFSIELSNHTCMKFFLANSFYSVFIHSVWL